MDACTGPRSPSASWAPVDRARALAIMFAFPCTFCMMQSSWGSFATTRTIADRFADELKYDPECIELHEISSTMCSPSGGELRHSVTVRPTPDGRGRGAYAASSMAAGSFAVYEGLLVPKSDEILNDHPYALDQRDAQEFTAEEAFYAPLVLGDPFSWTSYVNHGKSANLRLLRGVRGSNPSLPWPFLVCTRGIDPGEELTLDYDACGSDGAECVPFAEAQARRRERFLQLRSLACDAGLDLAAVFAGMHAWEAVRSGDPPGSWPPSPPELQALWVPLLCLCRGTSTDTQAT